jgi:hypothetical protein
MLQKGEPSPTPESQSGVFYRSKSGVMTQVQGIARAETTIIATAFFFACGLQLG